MNEILNLKNLKKDGYGGIDIVTDYNNSEGSFVFLELIM